ncbi:uncharacterized protein M421DRAFT_92020 [Didymella exigua CBS 183.55]|uniref:Integral membrane protein n=1 Tax=Didymella exigua CBS 183.55 TaxID=1150837 RepID=A0A6A5RMK5_9PLEO|nr:uncharacterized protein M421DRAFT_92020 [Didymella exigua CBS 183.55]KAF1928889.1 hypothetical protein M421DRAFT_92020 [Didymella exigua CBS 183.55]
MDKLNLQQKARTARNRLAEAVSRGNGTGSLAVPPSTLAINDNASTTGVNEGFPGQSAARDFAVPERMPVPQPRIEPPTSLQSSVDAGKRVPVPPPRDARPPNKRGMSSPLTPQRARSNSAPHRSPVQQRGLPQQQNSPHSRPSPGFRQASIGIRRMPSSISLNQYAQATNPSSQRLSQPLDTLEEGRELGRTPSASSGSTLTQPEPSRLRKARSAIQTRVSFWNSPSAKEKEKSPEPFDSSAQNPADEGMNYTSDMVDVLDTLDPEIATLTSLTNLQNSLFVPNLPFFNRRPTYNLRRAPSETASIEEINRILGPAHAAQAESELQPPPRLQRTDTEGTTTTLATIDSQLSDSRYAVLPPGTSLEGWSRQDKAEVNDHVRHMLHSKRSKFKRSMRGFGQYVRRPLGFLVTLYATLITLFGLAWVLFLIGWINVGGRQIYVVHIIDSVLVALFAIVGDGLAPFRAIDTYHMIYIAHYHHYTWSRRKKDMLPALHDQNDLPSTNAPITGPRTIDPGDPEKQWEFTVLTPKQQQKLEHHQEKFCKSHSFYKPHETETHYAFPQRFLVAIVVLLDCHSLLQISLGATTWGIYYKHRHFAITTVILICSITCNATAGLLIWLGDKRTRKTDVLERMNRQELTDEAIKKVEKKKGRESESEGDELTKNERKGRLSLDIIRKKTQGSSSGKSGKSAEPQPTAQNPYP